MSEKVPEGYKKTELGEIPEEWSVVKLGSLCEVITKGTTPTTVGFSYQNNGINFVKIESIDKNGNFLPNMFSHISEDANKALKRSILRENDLLFSIAGALGRVAIVNSEILPANTNQALAIIRLKKDQQIDLEYVYCFLNGPQIQKHIDRINVQSAQANLSLENMNNFKIALPKKEEQQKIASILLKVDEQIEQTEKVIEITEFLKKGLMQKLLIKGIGHTKFKKTELGEIPEEWKITKLKENCLDALSGGTPSTSMENYWNGDIPWMTSSNISGVFIKNGQKNITKDGLDNSASKLVPKNNLIVATRVGLGKLAVNLIDISISQDLTGLIIDKNKANSLFLYWALKFSEKKIISYSQGSTIKGILKSDLLNFNIQLPPLPEQQKIASILSKVDSQIQDNKSYVTRLQELKKGLMQDLLTGKVRVCV